MHKGLELLSMLDIEKLIEVKGEQETINLIEEMISGKAETSADHIFRKLAE